MEKTTNSQEKDIVSTTITSLTEQLNHVKNWLDDKKSQVGDSLESWQAFIQIYNALRGWIEKQKNFLSEPLKFSTLNEARAKLHEYTTTVKECKWANKQVADMQAELVKIGQVSNVSPLADKQAEIEQEKSDCESRLKEVMALLQEMAEEWEQCERKSKDVATWIEKTRQSLDNPQNKKRSLRDQLIAREKALADVTIQKTKLTMAMEKLKVHFRDRMCANAQVSHENETLQSKLEQLQGVLREDCKTLEACVHQMDVYQQEVHKLRQSMVGVEQQLRLVSGPSYSPRDREKAVSEQGVLQSQFESIQRHIVEAIERIYQIDPLEAISTEPVNETTDLSSTISRQGFAFTEAVETRTIPVYEGNMQEKLDSEVSEIAVDDFTSMPNLSSFPITWADVAAGRRSPAVFIPKEYQEVTMPTNNNACSLVATEQQSQPISASVQEAGHLPKSQPSNSKRQSDHQPRPEDSSAFYSNPSQTEYKEISKKQSGNYVDYYPKEFNNGSGIRDKPSGYGRARRPSARGRSSEPFVGRWQNPYQRGRGTKPREYIDPPRFERSERSRGRRGGRRGDSNQRFHSRGTTRSRENSRGSFTPVKESPVHSSTFVARGRKQRPFVKAHSLDNPENIDEITTKNAQENFTYTFVDKDGMTYAEILKGQMEKYEFASEEPKSFGMIEEIISDESFINTKVGSVDIKETSFLTPDRNDALPDEIQKDEVKPLQPDEGFISSSHEPMKTDIVYSSTIDVTQNLPTIDFSDEMNKKHIYSETQFVPQEINIEKDMDPHQTTNKAEQTTNKAEQTTNKAEQTTNKVEQTTNKAEVEPYSEPAFSFPKSSGNNGEPSSFEEVKEMEVKVAPENTSLSKKQGNEVDQPFTGALPSTQSKEQEAESILKEQSEYFKEALEKIDTSKYSYAQILAMGLTSVPGKVASSTMDVFKSAVSNAKDSNKPKQKETKYRSRSSETYYAHQEHYREKEKFATKPVIQVIPSENKDDRASKNYIPGLLFIDGSERRNRSKSERRRKGRKLSPIPKGEQVMTVETEIQKMDSKKKGRLKEDRSSSRRRRRSTSRKERDSRKKRTTSDHARKEIPHKTKPEPEVKMETETFISDFLDEEEIKMDVTQIEDLSVESMELHEAKDSSCMKQASESTIDNSRASVGHQKSSKHSEDKKKKKKHPKPVKSHEDELEKALREIAEMERSGLIPRVSQTDKTKSKNLKFDESNKETVVKEEHKEKGKKVESENLKEASKVQDKETKYTTGNLKSKKETNCVDEDLTTSASLPSASKLEPKKARKVKETSKGKGDAQADAVSKKIDEKIKKAEKSVDPQPKELEENLLLSREGHLPEKILSKEDTSVSKKEKDAAFKKKDEDNTKEETDYLRKHKKSPLKEKVPFSKEGKDGVSQKKGKVFPIEKEKIFVEKENVISPIEENTLPNKENKKPIGKEKVHHPQKDVPTLVPTENVSPSLKENLQEEMAQFLREENVPFLPDEKVPLLHDEKVLENIDLTLKEEQEHKDIRNEPDKKEENKQLRSSFNLPIPDHASDWMEVIEAGGFTLDDDDDDDIVINDSNFPSDQSSKIELLGEAPSGPIHKVASPIPDAVQGKGSDLFTPDTSIDSNVAMNNFVQEISLPMKSFNESGDPLVHTSFSNLPPVSQESTKETLLFSKLDTSSLICPDEEWVDLELDEDAMRCVEEERLKAYEKNINFELGVEALRREDETEEALKPHFNKPDLKFSSGGQPKSFKIYGPNSQEVIALEGARNIFSQGSSSSEQETFPADVETAQEALSLTESYDKNESNKFFESSPTDEALELPSQGPREDCLRKLSSSEKDVIEYPSQVEGAPITNTDREPKTPTNSIYDPSLPDHTSEEWMDLMQDDRSSVKTDAESKISPEEKSSPKNQVASGTEGQNLGSKENLVETLFEKDEIRIGDILAIHSTAEFNLPIPDHGNQWMELIEEGGFTLDSEDEEEEDSKTLRNESQKPEDASSVKYVANPETSQPSAFERNVSNKNEEIMNSTTFPSNLDEQVEKSSPEKSMEMIEEPSNEEQLKISTECPVKQPSEVLEKTTDRSQIISEGISTKIEELVSTFDAEDKPKVLSSTPSEVLTPNTEQAATRSTENVPSELMEKEPLLKPLETKVMSSEAEITSNEKDVGKVTHVPFNLSLPDHASDWMDIIEGGGFSLDSEEEANEEDTQNIDLVTQEKMYLETIQKVVSDDSKPEEKSLEVEVLTNYGREPEKSTFNLPIPEHASDWMDIVAEGGFSLSSDSEGEDNLKNDLECPANKSETTLSHQQTDKEIQENKPSFSLPVPEHADDWIEIIEEGGFTLDDEDEEDSLNLSLGNSIPQKEEINSDSLPKSVHAEDWVELIEKGHIPIEENDAHENIEVSGSVEENVRPTSPLDKHFERPASITAESSFALIDGVSPSLKTVNSQLIPNISEVSKKIESDVALLTLNQKDDVAANDENKLASKESPILKGKSLNFGDPTGIVLTPQWMRKPFVEPPGPSEPPLSSEKEKEEGSNSNQVEELKMLSESQVEGAVFGSVKERKVRNDREDISSISSSDQPTYEIPLIPDDYYKNKKKRPKKIRNKINDEGTKPASPTNKIQSDVQDVQELDGLSKKDILLAEKKDSDSSFTKTELVDEKSLTIPCDDSEIHKDFTDYQPTPGDDIWAQVVKESEEFSKKYRGAPERLESATKDDDFNSLESENFEKKHPESDEKYLLKSVDAPLNEKLSSQDVSEKERKIKSENTFEPFKVSQDKSSNKDVMPSNEAEKIHLSVMTENVEDFNQETDLQISKSSKMDDEVLIDNSLYAAFYLGQELWFDVFGMREAEKIYYSNFQEQDLTEKSLIANKVTDSATELQKPQKKEVNKVNDLIMEDDPKTGDSQKKSDVNTYLSFLESYDSEKNLETEYLSNLQGKEDKKDESNFIPELEKEGKDAPSDTDFEKLPLISIAPNYDISAINDAEINFYKYLTESKKNQPSYSQVLLTPVPIVEKTQEEAEEEAAAVEEEEKRFIMLKTKVIPVVVKEEEHPILVDASTDEKGFTEFVSRQERRRRLRSSCSEDQDDSTKELVPYVPRIELPDVPISEEQSDIPIESKKEAVKQIEVSSSDEEHDPLVSKPVVKKTKDSKPRHDSRKRQTSHKKRHRSRVSEAEREVDDILAKILREEMLEKFGKYESFWRNKNDCEDNEKIYYELICQDSVSPPEQVENEEIVTKILQSSDRLPDSEGGNTSLETTITNLEANSHSPNNLPISHVSHAVTNISTLDKVSDVSPFVQTKSIELDSSALLTQDVIGSQVSSVETLSLNLTPPPYDIPSIHESETRYFEYMEKAKRIQVEEISDTGSASLEKDTTSLPINEGVEKDLSPSFGSQYDMVALNRAEADFYEVLAKESKVSWADVASHSPITSLPPEEASHKEEKGFILLQTKRIPIMVSEDGDRVPHTPTVAEVDEDGFVEYVSRQERRRRLRSSCSEDAEEPSSEVVPYVPRIEPVVPHHTDVLAKKTREIEPVVEEKTVLDKESVETKPQLQTLPPVPILPEIREEGGRKLHAEKKGFVDNAVFDSWPNLSCYSDAEALYQEMLAQKVSKVLAMSVFNVTDKDDHDKHDPPGKDGPPHPPPPPHTPPVSGVVREGGYFSPNTAEAGSFQPNWSDESTYLAPNPKSSSTTLPVSHTCPPHPTAPCSTLPVASLSSDSHDITPTALPKTLYSHSNLEAFGKSLVEDAFKSCASKLLQQSGSSRQAEPNLRSTEEIPQETLRSEEGTKPDHESGITAAVESQIESLEERIRALVDYGIVEQISILQKLISEMDTMEKDLSLLEEKGRLMTKDSEMLNMLAAVSGMKTRLKSMKASAIAKEKDIRNKQNEEQQQRLHLVEYQRLLQDLECWVIETYSQMSTETTFTSVAAVRENFILNQNLLKDLTLREKQLNDLRLKCEEVKGDSYLLKLAKEMTEHLCFLSKTICDTRTVLQNRLYQLKVRICQHGHCCPYISSNHSSASL